MKSMLLQAHVSSAWKPSVPYVEQPNGLPLDCDGIYAPNVARQVSPLKINPGLIGDLISLRCQPALGAE